MDKNFDYRSVPSNYAHCFNDQCVKSEQCLRHLVAKNCTSQHTTLCIINPHCIPADTALCTYFKDTRKVHMAWGIKHIFDDIPYKKVCAMRQQLITHFGKTAFYRFYRQEQPLTPKEQAYIRRVFKNNDIEEEPQFDRYSDEYSF